MISPSGTNLALTIFFEPIVNLNPTYSSPQGVLSFPTLVYRPTKYMALPTL